MHVRILAAPAVGGKVVVSSRMNCFWNARQDDRKYEPILVNRCSDRSAGASISLPLSPPLTLPPSLPRRSNTSLITVRKGGKRKSVWEEKEGGGDGARAATKGIETG